jgi:AcrR family transcriptional regulator
MSHPRVRMSPDSRREQLLGLGVRLLATRSIEDLSIDMLAEEAGVSRGLLYHYFGSKQDFHRAVVRHAADQLIAVTAPRGEGEPLELLATSLAAYVDYVVDNREGYTSLVRGATSGNAELRAIHAEAQAVLTERIFTTEAGRSPLLALLGVEDTPAARLMVRAWSALTEDAVLRWTEEPAGVTREQLVELLSAALPGVLQRLALGNDAAGPPREGTDRPEV